MISVDWYSYQECCRVKSLKWRAVFNSLQSATLKRIDNGPTDIAQLLGQRQLCSEQYRSSSLQGDEYPFRITPADRFCSHVVGISLLTKEVRLLSVHIALINGRGLSQGIEESDSFLQREPERKRVFSYSKSIKLKIN